MWSAGLLLLQRLVRDLWVLKIAVRPADQRSRQESCLCIESAIGGVFIVVGALMLFAGLGGSVFVPPWAWTGAMTLIWLFY